MFFYVVIYNAKKDANQSKERGALQNTCLNGHTCPLEQKRVQFVVVLVECIKMQKKFNLIE